MNKEAYQILSEDDFTTDEAAVIRKACDEAEQGYTDQQLDAAVVRPVGRPLSVGASRASNVIRVRLDNERNERIESFRAQHQLSKSEAVCELIDRGLAAV